MSIQDGDTITTSEGIVRIIGIDTPEQGQCGFEPAKAHIGALLSVGDEVSLELPAGQNDTDKHGRLLRYVVTASGVDVGESMIEAGFAIARYDSTDGYPAHPHESDYRTAQLATLTQDGAVLTEDCRIEAEKVLAEQQAAVEPTVDEAVVPAPPAAAVDEWWLQYGSCSKLKKNTNGHPTGPFNVNDPAQTAIYNWFQYGTGHSGDGDGDGWACE